MAFLFYRKTSHSQCTFRHATSLTKPGPSSVLVFWWKASRKYSPITNKTFYRAVSLAGAAKEKQQAQLKSPAKTISLFGFLPFFSFFRVLQIRKCCFRGGSFGHLCDAPKMKPRGRAEALWHTAECNLKIYLQLCEINEIKVWHPTAAAIDYFLNRFIHRLLSLILFNLFTKPLPRHHFQSFADIIVWQKLNNYY